MEQLFLIAIALTPSLLLLKQVLCSLVAATHGHRELGVHGIILARQIPQGPEQTPVCVEMEQLLQTATARALSPLLQKPAGFSLVAAIHGRQVRGRTLVILARQQRFKPVLILAAEVMAQQLQIPFAQALNLPQRSRLPIIQDVALLGSRELGAHGTIPAQQRLQEQEPIPA